MQKEPGIVLHRMPYGDTSWILKMLLRESGVVSFLVKGGRGAKCPFKSSLSPLTASEVVFRARPGRDLQFFKDATLRAHFPRLHAGLESLAAAQGLAEIFLRLARPAGSAEEFDLLLRSLFALDAGEPPRMLFARTLQSLCAVLGYSPVFDSCTLCGEPLDPSALADIWFSSGGAVCAACLGAQKPLHSAGLVASVLQNQFAVPAVAGLYLRHLRTHTGALENLKTLDFFQSILLQSILR
jgi:DNA repair protein RecO (recombination protein O)